MEHDGELYQIPYKGPGATGLGKPLKSILHGDPSMPIYAASITPIGLRTAGEVADGVLPIFMSPEKTRMVTEPLLQGIARGRAGRSLADFDVAPYVRIAMGADLQACRDALKPELALYIGGMGARAKNFYNDFTKQLGYEEAAVKIQDAFLSGRRAEAVAAVPDALVDEVSLVGSAERIKDRLKAWKEAGKKNEVGSMLLSGVTVDSLRVAAEAYFGVSLGARTPRSARANPRSRRGTPSASCASRPWRRRRTSARP